MILEHNNIANIELINTENYLNKEGYYEIDFYPEREFSKEVYVFFHIVESWGNVHWYKMFNYYDSKNIKVICYASFNFLPIARNLGHKVFLEKTNTAESFYAKRVSRMSTYGLNRHRFWHTYNINKKGGYIEARPWFQEWLMTDDEAWKIGQKNKTLPIMIDEKEFDNFIKKKCEFGEEKIVVESKKKYNDTIKQKLHEKSNVYANQDFQRKILHEYTRYSYATCQILMSLYCGFSFVGIRGAASLLSMLPVNLLIGTDLFCSNLTTFSIRYHDAINEYFFDIPTTGFPHDLGSKRQIEGTWKEVAILFCVDQWLDSPYHYVPTKNITHFQSVNPKLKFLLDKKS